MSLPKLAFAFLGAPVLWSLHFGTIYVIDTLSCTEGWMGAGTAIIVVTVPFAALSALSGIIAWRGWRRTEPDGGEAGADTEFEEMFVEARGRERLLLAVGMMSAVLFTLLIVFEGLAPLVTPLCGEARP